MTIATEGMVVRSSLSVKQEKRMVNICGLMCAKERTGFEMVMRFAAANKTFSKPIPYT